MERESEKPLIWIGSSKRDLMALPVLVRKFFGHALHFAQNGERHDAAKVLKGFGSAGVLEVVEDEWYLPRGIQHPISGSSFRSALLSEEKQERNPNAKEGYADNSRSAQGGGGNGKGVAKWPSERLAASKSKSAPATSFATLGFQMLRS
jgi:hypothetical protein